MQGPPTNAGDFEGLKKKQRREQARQRAIAPSRAGDLVADVLRRRGVAGTLAKQSLQNAWEQTLVELGVPQLVRNDCRTGRINRGTLEVWVSHSVINHDLTFHAKNIVACMQRRVPDHGIRALRIRVGNEDHG